LRFNIFHVILLIVINPSHKKIHRSFQSARRERAMLRLVAGNGVIESQGGRGHTVSTEQGEGSVADLLAEVGSLSEAEARGVGARVARALGCVHDRGVVHGDIKPANIVFSTDGDLRLIDFDAAGATGSQRRRGSPARISDKGPLAPEADIVALAIMVVECATGAMIDSAAVWTTPALVSVGCSTDLAADVELILNSTPTAARVSAILQRRDDRLPTTRGRRGSVDPTPTVDMQGVAVAGLSPIGAVETKGPLPSPTGWRHWASRALG
jgi:serine/threonine protein kinase